MTQISKYDGFFAVQQTVGCQLGGDDSHNLRAQVVLFEQMANVQNADSIGNSLGAADADGVTVSLPKPC